MKMLVLISLMILAGCEYELCLSKEYMNSTNQEIEVIEYVAENHPCECNQEEYKIQSGGVFLDNQIICSDNIDISGGELGWLMRANDSVSIFSNGELQVTYYADWTRRQDDIRSGDGLGPYYIQNWGKRVEDGSDIYTFIIDESLFE